MKLIQDFINIFIGMAPYLLIGLTIAGVLHVTIKKEYVVRHIGKNNLGSVIKAALLGVPLPLCSCGVIPTGAYLKKSGASNGSVMSFLISTPQTGVDSIAATYAMLGPFYAIYRPVVAFLMGIMGGIASRFTIGNSVDQLVYEKEVPKHNHSEENTSGKIRRIAKYAYGELLDDLSINLIVGIGLAALITFFIPDGFLENTVFANGLPGMLLMIAIGIPMYVCSTSSIPIAAALILKGLSPGAAYVFLIAGPATNIAAITVLYRVLGKKQTGIFIGTIITGSLVFGSLMDFLSSKIGISFSSMPIHGHETTSIVNYIFVGIFSILLIFSLTRRFSAKYLKKNKEVKMEEVINPDMMLNIEGMTCHHCEFNVTNALESVSGVTNVKIDLASKKAFIEGDAEKDELIKAVQQSGYKVV